MGGSSFVILVRDVKPSGPSMSTTTRPETAPVTIPTFACGFCRNAASNSSGVARSVWACFQLPIGCFPGLLQSAFPQVHLPSTIP